MPLMLANSSSASSRGSSPCWSSLAAPPLSAGPRQPGRAGSAPAQSAAVGPARVPALGHLAAGQLLERGRVELAQRVQLRAHAPTGVGRGSTIPYCRPYPVAGGQQARASSGVALVWPGMS